MHKVLDTLAFDIGTLSLTNLYARVGMVCLIVLVVLWAGRAFYHHHLRHRVLFSFLAAIITGWLTWAVLEVWWRPFPDHLPFWFYLWISAAAFVVYSAFVQKGRRILLSIAALAAVATTMGSLNFLYNQYPNIDSLTGENTTSRITYEQFQAQAQAIASGSQAVPAEGVVFDLPIASTTSHFHHRSAIAYVPPAYFSDPNVELPVIVLMHGNPGSPDAWFDGGQVSHTMDDFAAEHHGLSPIVVSIDATGSVLANPICADSPHWKTMTYIAIDVPASIKKELRVDSDQSHWAIGGLSYGGTCSLQVVTNHPDAFGTFLDISGQAEPTVGTRKDTVSEIFDGDEAAFVAQNPADLLTQAAGTDKYAHLAGRFVAGTGDKESRQALSNLNKLAQAANIDSDFQVVPGRHDWTTWRAGFDNNLDFLVERSHLLDNESNDKAQSTVTTSAQS